MFTAFQEAPVGPKGFDVECNLDDLSGNYEGVRTQWFATPPTVAALLDFHMHAFADPRRSPPYLATPIHIPTSPCGVGKWRQTAASLDTPRSKTYRARASVRPCGSGFQEAPRFPRSSFRLRRPSSIPQEARIP